MVKCLQPFQILFISLLCHYRHYRFISFYLILSVYSKAFINANFNGSTCEKPRLL